MDIVKKPQEYISMAKKKKVNGNYIDKEKFQHAMFDYIQAVNADPNAKISNYIGKCIYDIAEHLGQMPRFHNYSYLDEMKEDGIENAIRYINNYDPVRFNNPFQYFSVIIYYAFIRRIAREKKEQYIKYKITANYGIFDDIVSYESGGSVVPIEQYDNMVEYIEVYEGKKTAKNEKTNTKKAKKGLEILLEDE